MIDLKDWNTNIKLLGGVRDPEPSNHPDARMNLRLRDMQACFNPPWDHDKERARLNIKISKY